VGKSERSGGTDNTDGAGPPKKEGWIARLARAAVARALGLRVVRAYLLYSEHRGPMLADSITYRSLFSVFAAVLLTFSLAALWLGSNPTAMGALMGALEAVIPGIAKVIDPSRINAPMGFTLVGVVSLVALVGAAIGAISSLRTAFRVLADEYADDAFFLWVLLRNLLVAIALGGLLGVAAAATFFGSAGIGAIVEWLGMSKDSWVATASTRAFGILVVFAIDTVAIALAFRILGGLKPSHRALWTGALLGGLGLIVLQELSALFVRGAASNPLLASFASLIALLLWFNLSAQVILIASSYIITATEEGRDKRHKGVSTFTERRVQRARYRAHAADEDLRTAQEAQRREQARS
jgi:membrane protein